MKKKPLKCCKLSTCKKLLILCKKPVKGCCDEEHFTLWKKEYNANYYDKKNEVVLNEKYSIMLRCCLRQFGENVPFDAEILDIMGFDWGFSNMKVEIEGLVYSVIGEFAFTGITINKIKKIKIVRYE
jgi:hypothetical protein